MLRRGSLALLATTLAGTALYRSRLGVAARLLRLPTPRYPVESYENRRVRMADGVTLATDHFRPVGPSRAPTVLVRTPYGRPGGPNGLMPRWVARLIAGQGYHVIYQDTRGRGQSEGEWEPYVHEAADGAATVDWIVAQPWSDGQVATYGQSYVGYVQWALASTEPPSLRAMVPAITQSYLGDRGDHAYQLDRTLRWLLILEALDNPELGWRERLEMVRNPTAQDAIIERASRHLPLATVDEALQGRPAPIFRNWMAHPDTEDTYWQAIDHREQVAAVEAAVHLVGGWYDIFIEGQIEDYQRLRAAGRHPYLTVGPWIHVSLPGQLESIRQSLAWYAAHLHGRHDALRGRPVRYYVMGAEEWREAESWPPPTHDRAYHAHAQGLLFADEPSLASAMDHYRYDPADPTPNLGGPLLSVRAGPVDQRPIEARLDVLTYTTPPLAEPIEIAGTPRCRLFARSSLEHTDFLARLCDVHPDGRSINICDGLFRVTPERVTRDARGTMTLEIPLTPTAHRFLAGHRIRLQITSGAFPRYTRNPGTGGDEFEATELRVADQTILHDSQYPTALVLPVRDDSGHAV